MSSHRNILISSAGKRVELLLEFQRELKNILPDAQVIAADLNPDMAPACHLADKAIGVPRVNDPEFIPELLRICLENHVGLVIPTIDTELLILADARPLFADNGIEIMVSDRDFIARCRDKRLTSGLFNSLDIPTPEPRDKHNPVFPMFAKPYDGSLSADTHVILSAGQLTRDLLENPKLIFMELVDKSQFKEFTVDIYFDRLGRLMSVVPRERLAVRSGEINKGVTRKNFIVDFLKSRIDSMPGVRGCICMQLFYRPADAKILAIEINPRFGGGYPLSYYAGANFPELMIREYLLGEKPEYSSAWKDNTVMLRYDSQVIIQE